jgi:RNA polymerase sigma-70 factor (ECF subfamily)
MNDKRLQFEAQILPHLDGAYRFARWLARSTEGVDDVVQEAVLRAYRSFDTLRGPDAKAWLMTIVRNCYFTARKREQQHALEPLPDDYTGSEEPTLVANTPDPESALIHQDEQDTLARLVAQLPGEFRGVLVLREMEDMDYRQIAAVTGIPLGTVMSRLARARAALRKQWLLQSGETRAVP